MDLFIRKQSEKHPETGIRGDKGCSCSQRIYSSILFFSCCQLVYLVTFSLVPCILFYVNTSPYILRTSLLRSSDSLLYCLHSYSINNVLRTWSPFYLFTFIRIHFHASTFLCIFIWRLHLLMFWSFVGAGLIISSIYFFIYTCMQAWNHVLRWYIFADLAQFGLIWESVTTFLPTGRWRRSWSRKSWQTFTVHGQIWRDHQHGCHWCSFGPLWSRPEKFSAGEFVFVVTDSKGEKAYGFCRRVLPCGPGGRWINTASSQPHFCRRLWPTNLYR